MNTGAAIVGGGGQQPQQSYEYTYDGSGWRGLGDSSNSNSYDSNVHYSDEGVEIRSSDERYKGIPDAVV